MPQVETHLLAEQRVRACACAVRPHCPVLDHVRDKVQILHASNRVSMLDGKQDSRPVVRTDVGC